MRVCHFEDHLVADLEPLTLTRPAFELLCGCATLAEKQRRHLAPSTAEVGYLVRPHLIGLLRDRHRAAAVNDPRWLRNGPVVLVNARWLPPVAPAWDGTDRPCVALADGEVAWAVLPPERLPECWTTLQDCLPHWADELPRRDAGGRLVRHLWELVDRNGEQIGLDAWLTGPERPCQRTDLPTHVGPADRLLIDPTARIEPMVLCDTTAGPIVIAEGAVVTAFTRLEGPCYVGPGTHVLGAKVRGGTSLGPDCRVGGEVEASVVLGHTNKYHDGFLGHAYVGEWVNLGAGTSNSDLRNDYGEVTVIQHGRPVRTARHKVGCFLGDHTKTGLGTLLNTGTSVGAFCHLLPSGGLLPKYAPSFTGVCDGALRDNADLPALLRTAEVVMARRGQRLSEAYRAMAQALLERTTAERRRAIRDAEARRLRRSA